MLNEQDYADRQIRAAVKERDELYLSRFAFVPLDEPIQRGWLRFFVLGEHAKRRRDADTLTAILAVINTKRRSRNREFMVRQRRTKRLIEIEQSVRSIRNREWEKRSLPAAWFPYFHIYHYYEWERPAFRAEFAYPSLFTLHIEPNWVWHIHDVDPAVETRISELDRWIESRGRWRRWGWLNGEPQRYRWREQESAKQRSLWREHEKLMCNAMRGEVEPAASKRRVRLSLSQMRIFFPGVAQ
jgi:hypothetical protein